MVTVTIDVGDAKVLLEEARRKGGGRLRALWEWSRGFAERGLEALLGMELTVLLERERAAGITGSSKPICLSRPVPRRTRWSIFS